MQNGLRLSILLIFTVQTLALPWQTFKNDGGNFSVLVPGAMHETITKVKTELGEMAYHQFVCRTLSKADGKILYTVNYCDYPKGSFPTDSLDFRNDFFATTIENSAQAVKGTVVYQDNVMQQTYSAKLWRVNFNNDMGHIKSKCFLVGDRFYMLQIIVADNNKNDANSDKFFDTFLVQ